MRNKLILFCYTIVASLLVACGSQNLEKDVKATFVGEIDEIRGDNNALVIAFRENGKALGQISVDLTVNPNETFQAGDKIRVGYDGMIGETAPQVINTLTVEKVE